MDVYVGVDWGCGSHAVCVIDPLGWRLAAQLTARLDGFWPGGVAIFADVASPIALAVLDRYPTPDSARRLGHARLASFLARHRTSGHRSPETLLERARAAPLGHAGDAERQARSEMVRALARTLSALVDRLSQLTRRIEDTRAALPDGRIVMSFPRAARICAAQILAEPGDVRERFQTNDQLAARGRCRSRRWRERQIQRRRLPKGP